MPKYKSKAKIKPDYCLFDERALYHGDIVACYCKKIKAGKTTPIMVENKTKRCPGRK